MTEEKIQQLERQVEAMCQEDQRFAHFWTLVAAPQKEENPPLYRKMLRNVTDLDLNKHRR